MLLQWTCFRLDGEYNEDLTVPNKKPNQTRSKPQKSEGMCVGTSTL